MSLNHPEEKLTAIREAIFAGRKIEAIRIYRELAGGGLKEAKDAVEGLEMELRKESPDKFAAPKGAGCFAAAAALVVGLGGLGGLVGIAVTAVKG